MKKTKIVRKTKKTKIVRKTKKNRKTKKYRGGTISVHAISTVENKPYSYNNRYRILNGIYTGQWKYEMPYVRGKMDYLDNDGNIVETYDGNWVNGKPDGTGVLTFANGEKYVGEFKIGLMDGKGIYTYTTGARYEGDFVRNGKHGYGIFTYNNGARYEGQWENNKKHGYGISTYNDGSRYEGGWANDKKNGTGTFVTPNERYTGNWVDDMADGYGILIHNDGSRYEGQWANNRKNGYGIFETPNEKYTGNWVHDEIFGHGIITFKQSNVSLEGEFSYDSEGNTLVNGTAEFPDGSRYEGMFEDYLRSGGIATPNDGSLASDSKYDIVYGYEEEPDSVTAVNISYYNNTLLPQEG